MIFSAKEVLLAATISRTILPLPVRNFLRKSFNTSMKEAVIHKVLSGDENSSKLCPKPYSLEKLHRKAQKKKSRFYFMQWEVW